ncbi:MAG TPA: toll/interleukin-1 receptor domain-containing protein [Terriglobales bacterium]|nr:toll/interleukin-1 receptor domain-containing protein [Terriglobales bacterium]
MPVFISYSHADSKFVTKLATQLVRRNAHVWVDQWELNVGDSLLNRIQDAIQDASALLVVLSKASVASEWCKKELNAGLIRELDEKRVIVLPVLLEDCEIPPFLREKKYADFRKNFDAGLTALTDALLRVTSADQGRVSSGTGHTDWSEDWLSGPNGSFSVHYTFVEAWAEHPFTVLTQVMVLCNDIATRRYRLYESVNLGWVGRLTIAEVLAEFAEKNKIKILLKDHRPQEEQFVAMDFRTGASYKVRIMCRRLGEDNGKDQLITVSNYLWQIRDAMKSRSRKLTEEESAKLQAVLQNS